MNSPNASKAELLASLTPQERRRYQTRLSEADLEALNFDWSFWARPKQLAPKGNEWSVWFLLGGRGFGKTRSGAEWVRSQMCGRTPLGRGIVRHMAIVAETAKDARDVMIGEGRAPGEGSGLLQVCPPGFRPIYEKSKRRLVWPNGAIASIYNATDPDQLRGPEHEAAWCDEIAKWRYLQESWDNLQFSLRQGKNPRVCITTTPRPVKLLKEILADAGTAITTGSTFENVGNLAPKFLVTMRRKYEGTRIGRQELRAEILDDVPGALWTRAALDALRIGADNRPLRLNEVLPKLRRIVVAVDPSGSAGEDSETKANSIGIVVAGLGFDGQVYVLADRSCDLSPDGWGRRTVEAYYEFDADRIVAEKNFGGAMVEHVIRTSDKRVPVRMVNASRGKVVRAEPVAALYEQKRVHHVGALPELEDQMCAMTPSGYVGGGSPDRADALVWAISELMLGRHNEVSSGHVSGLY
jgi:phage terminase large subunit-like protein